MIRNLLSLFVTLLAASALRGADDKALSTLLAKEIIGPRQGMIEAQDYCEARIPKMPAVTTAAEWEALATRLRADVLARVVYRGAAADWRDAKTRVDWLDTIAGGPGYRIKKLRYEALPGLWIPALLYEPEKLSGPVPVHLAVNGHDRNGKQAPYKQVRCINLAKRGIISLNVEWLRMGQLSNDNYLHYRMNQLDLCGTSGLAPFYLSMKRGLDILLALEHADPKRVAVSGLSGGGWQTIVISALDTRVTLCNPVAGYSSFRTRVRFLKDLGDSEQTPCDLAAVADYSHLTAMMAPRATLLTYNAKDNCCFEAGYALPPLLDAAGPIFKLFDREKALRAHVNHDPGDHNFLKDNRQAFYRMIGDHFYPGSADFKAEEIPCDNEVKSKEDLFVELPAQNADFHSLALGLSKALPRVADLPGDRTAAQKWQESQRARLREVVRAKQYGLEALKMGSDDKDGLRATFWKVRMDRWTVPVVELSRGVPKTTTILLGDNGRRSLVAETERLLQEGSRVLAVDPFYFGESKIEQKDFLFALLVAAVGDRPLGIQASQVAALARWAHETHKGPVGVVAVGPRTAVVALIAAGLEEKAIGKLEVHDSLGSLKEIIEQNRTVTQMPELFCFGLLEAFDLKQLTALCTPRPAQFVKSGERARKELASLKAWYALFGVEFEPSK